MILGDPSKPQRIIVKGGITPMPERPVAVNRLFTPGRVVPLLNNPYGNAKYVGSIGQSRRAPINVTYDALPRTQIQGNPRLKISSIYQAGEQRQDFFRSQRTDQYVLDPVNVLQYRTNPLTHQDTSLPMKDLPEFYRKSERQSTRIEFNDGDPTTKNVDKYLNGNIKTAYYGFQHGSNGLLGMDGIHETDTEYGQRANKCDWLKTTHLTKAQDPM